MNDSLQPGDRHYVKSAVLSPCRNFRYQLIREWDSSLHKMVFVMLNPSTADADNDDPTIRKCVGFARIGGYGGIIVVNLFAYRATSPSELKRAGWLQGDDNDRTLSEVLYSAKRRGSPVVCAWGANARGRPEAGRFMESAGIIGVDLFAFKTSPDGTPHHPLMLPYASKLEPLPWSLAGTS